MAPWPVCATRPAAKGGYHPPILRCGHTASYKQRDGTGQVVWARPAANCTVANYGSGGGGGGYSSGGGGGYGRERAPRQMTQVTCSICGRQTEAPFVPTGDRPVYCSDCYSRQGGGSSRGGSRGGGGGRY